MSITAEKVEQVARIIDPHKWSLHDAAVGDLYAGYRKSLTSCSIGQATAILSLLQQGEPEGWREAKRIADLWFEPWGAAKAIEWEFSGDVPFTPENALRKIQRLLSASPLPPAPGAETDPSAEDCAKITAAQVGNEKLTPLSEPWGFTPSRQAVLEEKGGTPFGIIDPDYARVYTLARVVAWQEGYALTLHGSFTRDLDLVAVPWTDRACEPEHLAKRIEEATKLKNNGAPTKRPHDRLTWTLLFPEFGDPRFVDLSVFATTPPAEGETK
ncbi:MAG: hypothetical protein KF826_03375 [Xanthobacteraceae bacterium]|nr:hypothetical protein [Xanthobacteraceae bacterium]MCW5679655.1 hypothetical protein [Xanthobacteraceae bacterium]